MDELEKTDREIARKIEKMWNPIGEDVSKILDKKSKFRLYSYRWHITEPGQIEVSAIFHKVSTQQ